MMWMLYAVLILLAWAIVSVAWFFHAMGANKSHWYEWVIGAPMLPVAWAVGHFLARKSMGITKKRSKSISKTW